MTQTTHDDDATTWRDLADQLTPEQFAELTYCERENVPPGDFDRRQGLLNCARAHIERNLLQSLCADIPTPPDAIDEPSDWEQWDTGYYRTYTVAPSVIEGSTARVKVYGTTQCATDPPSPPAPWR